MSDQSLDYAAIQRNVETGVLRQKWLYRKIFFGMHLTFFIVTMLVVWAIALTNSQLRDTLFNTSLGAALVIILPTLMWAMVLLFHCAALFIESDAAEESMRQQLLASEIREEILRNGLAEAGTFEKPKNRVLLSNDGELVPAGEEQLEQHNYNPRTQYMGKP